MSGFTEQKIIAVEYLKDAMIFFSKAGIVLPKDAVINIYHHNGAGHIRETGAVFINIVNRDYCKSYIVMLQGQNYPCHYHKIKTESFYLLFGSLGVYIEEQEYLLEPGEMLHIERGQDHSFWTDTGAVFEEISTMYMPNDSVYIEQNIRETRYAQRKTSIRMDEWKEISRKWKR